MQDAINFPVQELPEMLSALMDGEASSQDTAAALDQWEADPSARSDWHLFHQIRDVLCAQDLASHAAHDAQFLGVIRQRLALERTLPPVVALRITPPWLWSCAAGLGVVALGWSLWIGFSNPPAGGAEYMASLPLAAPPQIAPPESAANPLFVISRDVSADAPMNPYLSAHQQLVGSSALGGASGFIRAIARDAPAQ